MAGQRWAVLLIGIIVLLVVSTWLDRLFSRLTSGVRISSYSQTASVLSGRLIVYLPGILADGDNSAESVINVWRRYGDVVTVSYTGDSFDAAGVVRIVAATIRNDRQHDNVVLVGSSMGGMLALDVIDNLRRHGGLTKKIDIIFVDSPASSRDMLAGGNVGAPVMRALPFGRLYNWLGAPLMRVMLIPPKDENIEPQLDRETIKREAMAAMGVYRLSMWRDQLVYMAAHPRLKQADFVGINRLVYLQCSRNNETVKQPQAADAWGFAAGRMFTIRVDSTHCGYRERPVIWQEAFASVFRRL